MAVVGEAADGAEALAVAREARPDVTLLDLSMPRTNGVKTIGQLARLRPATRVLVLTMHDDPAYVDSALAAGASGYVVKKAADLELLSAIRAVSRGRHAVDATLTTGGSHSTPSRGRLSRRESEVLRLLGQGLTNRQVAAQLRLSVKTRPRPPFVGLSPTRGARPSRFPRQSSGECSPSMGREPWPRARVRRMPPSCSSKITPSRGR
jgi:DNA-binding NarL/FixJ family response regulator